VNLSLILQLFVRDRWGRVRSAAREWSHALKQDLNLSRTRRMRGGGSRSLQAESLEVRQVLSAADPAVFAVEPSPDVVLPVGSDFDTSSDAQWLVQSLRTEFLAALESSKSPLSSFTQQASRSSVEVESESVPGIVGRLDLGALADIADAQSSDLPLSDERPLSNKLTLSESDPADEPQAGQLLRVEVAFDWTKGPRRFSFVAISNSSWQVTLGGLGGTSLAEADFSFAQQLVSVNAAEIIRSVQPDRILEISFQKSETLKESLIRFGSDSSSGPSASIHHVEQEIQSRPVVQGVVSRNGKHATPASFLLPGDFHDRFSLLDEVFRADSFFLDDTSIPSEMTVAISVGGHTSLTENASGSRSVAGSVRSRLSNVDSTDAASAASGTEASAATVRSHGNINRLVRRGWNWMRGSRISSGGLAGELTGVARHFSLSEFSVSSVGAIDQPQSSASIAGTVNWLAQLMDPSGRTTETAGLVRGSDYLELNIRPTAVPVFHQDNVLPRDRQLSGYDIRSQARRYRESQRQIVAHDASTCLRPEEFESPMLPASGSIPRELRYVARPRGPPVYGRDANVPFGERDAPASLLERLRYSIAPRGPSLVVAEMQSPELPSFSGPRVSPERSACQLAC